MASRHQSPARSRMARTLVCRKGHCPIAPLRPNPRCQYAKIPSPHHGSQRKVDRRLWTCGRASGVGVGVRSLFYSWINRRRASTVFRETKYLAMPWWSSAARKLTVSPKSSNKASSSSERPSFWASSSGAVPGMAMYSLSKAFSFLFGLLRSDLARPRLDGWPGVTFCFFAGRWWWR